MYIPEGFGTVTPYMFTKDAPKFIEFLKNAFDAKEIGRTTTPDGTVAHAELRLGSSSIMISEAQGKYHSMPASYYLYTEDVDSTVKRAIELGAKPEGEVSDQPYGDRQGGVVDPHGNIWWISKRLEQEPYYS